MRGGTLLRARRGSPTSLTSTIASRRCRARRSRQGSSTCWSSAAISPPAARPTMPRGRRELARLIELGLAVDARGVRYGRSASWRLGRDVIAAAHAVRASRRRARTARRRGLRGSEALPGCDLVNVLPDEGHRRQRVRVRVVRRGGGVRDNSAERGKADCCGNVQHGRGRVGCIPR